MTHFKPCVKQNNEIDRKTDKCIYKAEIFSIILNLRPSFSTPGEMSQLSHRRKGFSDTQAAASLASSVARTIAAMLGPGYNVRQLPSGASKAGTHTSRPDYSNARRVWPEHTKFSAELGASNKLLVNSGPSRQLLCELRRRAAASTGAGMVTAAPRPSPPAAGASPPLQTADGLPLTS